METKLVYVESYYEQLNRASARYVPNSTIESGSGLQELFINGFYSKFERMKYLVLFLGGPSTWVLFEYPSLAIVI
jgi:hypothetical protein